MARTEGNLFVDGFRGTVGGNMVFRKRKSGKLIIAKNRKKSTRLPTEQQQKVRDLFREASVYANAVMQNPTLKQPYAEAKKGDQTAYNLALRDFIKSPVVKSIDTAGYAGQPGNAIVIRATDDFKVITVKLSVFSAAGDLLEEGTAVADVNGLDWTYSATIVNSEVAGSTIKAIAVDTPGNTGSLEIKL